MAGVGNVLDIRELLVDDLFHGQINFFNVGVGGHSVHGAEHLGNIHDVPGIEEGNAVFVPFFAILAAQVLRAVFSGDFLYDFHFDIHNFLHALAGHVHEAAFFLKAQNFFDDGYRLSLVKETQNGGLYLLHDIPARHVTGMHVREQEGDVLAAFRLLKQLKGGLGNHAQGALAANKNLVQVGTGGVLWHWQGVDDVAVGQHHFQTDALVVNFAVFGRHNANAPMAQSAADGAAGQAGGNVLAGIALFVGVPFQLLKDHARLGGDGAAYLVNLNQAVHALHVHHDTAGHGQRAALAAAAAAPDIDGDFIIVGNFQNFGYFLGAAGTHDIVRHGRGLSPILPHAADPEIVHAIGGAVARRRGNILRSHHVLQFREDHVVHKGLAFHDCFTPQ